MNADINRLQTQCVAYFDLLYLFLQWKRLNFLSEPPPSMLVLAHYPGKTVTASGVKEIK